jgi:hypothetical protein
VIEIFTFPAVQSTTFIANLPNRALSYPFADTERVPVFPVVCSIQSSVKVHHVPIVHHAALFSNLGFVIDCQYSLYELLYSTTWIELVVKIKALSSYTYHQYRGVESISYSAYIAHHQVSPQSHSVLQLKTHFISNLQSLVKYITLSVLHSGFHLQGHTATG